MTNPTLRPAFAGATSPAAPAKPATAPPIKPRLPEPVVVRFAVNANMEFQWQFKDGSWSPWQAFPGDGLQHSPPAASEYGGCRWRPAMLRREPERKRATTSAPGEQQEWDPQP